MMKDKLINCDFCSNPCYHLMDDEGEEPNPENVAHEYATLKATWGYWSNKDQSTDEANICEKCYDTIIDFMYHLFNGKGKPRRYIYDMFTGEKLEQVKFLTEEQRKKKFGDK